MTAAVFNSHLYRNLPIADKIFLRCFGEELGRCPLLLAKINDFIRKNLRCCSSANLSNCAEGQRLEVCLEYLMLGIWLKCFGPVEIEKVARRHLSFK